MKKVRSLKHRRFGRLLVLEKLNKRKNKSAVWLCKCNCGKLKEVRRDCLISGNVKSCGCLTQRLPKGQSAFNELYRIYKKDALARGYIFKLSKRYFNKLTKQPCYYCGIEPKQIKRDSKNNGEYIYNGIDRVNSKKGYIKSNCVPCCKQCNKSKHILSKEAFLNWIKQVYNNSFGGLHEI